MAGNRSHNPIVLADDSSSDDDGGMQVDLEYPSRQYQRQRAMFGMVPLSPIILVFPRYGSARPGGWGPVLLLIRRATSNSHPDPDHGRATTSSTSTSTYRTTIEQEKKVRARLREERHAALSVLLDRELLMVQALAANEVCCHLFLFISSLCLSSG